MSRPISIQKNWPILRQLGPADALYLVAQLSTKLVNTLPIPDAARERFGQARKSFIRTWYPFDKHDLVDCLERVGVQKGATVFVHCSYEKFEGFKGKPSDVVAALLEAVGPSGNILMPTMPFTGSALEFVKRGVMLDVARTSSMMGLVSEVFRRTKGVQRSAHPTHPVAALGPKASELISDHYLATTPCGKHSPYAKLLDVDGKILFLGTGIGQNTFFHAVDEFLEAELPIPAFTKDWYSLQCKSADGSVVTCNTRLFATPFPRRRRGKISSALKRAGAWHERRVGRLRICMLAATDVLRISRELAERNEFFYAF
jgi:aminoglycoside 3-N-acetyltransferase